jgi:hypothetical protein
MLLEALTLRQPPPSQRLPRQSVWHLTLRALELVLVPPALPRTLQLSLATSGSRPAEPPEPPLLRWPPPTVSAPELRLAHSPQRASETPRLPCPGQPPRAPLGLLPPSRPLPQPPGAALAMQACVPAAGGLAVWSAFLLARLFEPSLTVLQSSGRPLPVRLSEQRLTLRQSTFLQAAVLPLKVSQPS